MAADKFKREMVARGVAQVVSELYANLSALVALSDEGIESSEWDLILFELNKREISGRDFRDSLEEFMNGFVARL